MPVMIIHGEKDRRFPLQFAQRLKNNFKPNQVELYVAPGAGHSDSSKTPGYQPAVKSFLDRHMQTEICK
jgi:pimeloyl-ACP methyl ester carboxylesterase